MLLPVLPLRDPLEKPPPDPPRAFAKERVGTPIRDNTMVAAMSFVLFKASVLSIDVRNQSRRNSYPNSIGSKKAEDSKTCRCEDCHLQDRQGLLLLLAEQDLKG